MDTRDVLICDVAPRDGLQIEERVLPPGDRADLCARLGAAGLARVEAASFVHPRLVPTMADAEQVIAAVPSSSATEWTGLVLNARGYQRAVESGLTRVNYTLAVTESFCRRNQGCGRAEAEAVAAGLAERARSDGVSLTITLAVAFGCPFEGRVPAAETLAMAERLSAAQPAEIVFADTIGVAVPSGVAKVFIGAAHLGPAVGSHFHDTRATGIANCVAALDAGCRLFDASLGGAGGCPFAPGATGNVATEDVVYLFEEMGLRTGIRLELLRDTSMWLSQRLGHSLPSAVARAGGFPAPALVSS